MSRLSHLVEPAVEPSPAERMRAALELYDEGLAVHRLRLGREHPEWSATQIEAALNAWLADRPAMGAGCPGLRDAMYRFEKWR